MIFLKSLDWKLNAAVLAIMAAGLLSLLSSAPNLFYKQLFWGIAGFVLFFLTVRFDWRSFVNYKGVIFGLYGAAIFLLVVVYFFAPTIRGTKGWLVVGPFHLQVVEFVKLVLVILFAYFFSRKHIYISKFSILTVSFIYFAIPAFLVALQPDFGSVLALFFVWFGFLLVSGIRWRHLIFSLIIFSLLAGAMWQIALKDYQKERILGVFSPEADPLGINYNVIQSKIAIGSAGFFGKGFGQGSQVQLGFLPEAQTDFIFAAFTEEWGMIAGFLLLVVFTAMVLRIIKIGLAADNNFSRFVSLGTAILFVTQFVLNIGSNLGLTPVVGVTFPFLSYGGSSLLTNLILVGIIQSVFIRR
ncbi:rod shape-determining protein RodA [Candidatus Wolfebacteria bacterium]|nr:rod shape-determining protein RodA [Candidatus Wolfebacteria bacterium]